MDKRNLELEFKNAEGRNCKVSIDDPKEDLTDEVVRTAMENIISQNIFETSGGELKLVVGADIVVTSETKLF